MGTFSAALKAMFYNKSTSITTQAAYFPALNSSGDPVGAISTANLASVLGAQYKSLTGVSSMDDLDLNIPTCFIPSSESPSDAPMTGSLLVRQLRFDQYVHIQVVTNGTASAPKYRVKTFTGWTSWKTLALAT